MVLPEPKDEELEGFISNGVTREIYRVLYESQATPLTIHEIREKLGPEVGVQQHLDRRLRDLDPYFNIERSRLGTSTAYKLLSRRETALKAEGGISKKLRAWVLRDQRCSQCGRTPTDDQVKLHVDHKVPQSWGGKNEPENLQALCSECNEGNRDYYASFADEAPEILEAFKHEEVHRRIGEALKAAYPKRVRTDLLERVANARSYQEDWQKRLRELRLLGFDIKASRQNEQGRTVAYYQLMQHAPHWPPGRIRTALRAIEKSRGY
jgi:hypothetical protein